MGLCSSSENLTPEQKAAKRKERERSRHLEQQMGADHSADLQINKLLLLGAGESGKSTLFKQMITIYGTGYKSEEQRVGFAPIIYSNIITSMKTLCQMSEHYGAVSDQNAKQVIEDLKGDEEVDASLASTLQALWRDAGIQTTYGERSHYQLTDSAAYFFERLDEVGHPAYCPSEQDVLRSRVRTTGIVENDFEIDGNQFKMFDVGGQRNERKKWIHCFENVTAVLFVAAISEYDQVLYEDENTNRMEEALNLFEEICNSRWFKNTSVILFLNKEDLFDQKIQKVPLSVCFPEYQGQGSVEGKAFLEAQFRSRKRDQDKKIYCHVTCATNTGQIEHVFDAVKDIVITESLKEAGLV